MSANFFYSNIRTAAAGGFEQIGKQREKIKKLKSLTPWDWKGHACP
jgi:oligoendopeptidase F